MIPEVKDANCLEFTVLKDRILADLLKWEGNNLSSANISEEKETSVISKYFLKFNFICREIMNFIYLEKHKSTKTYIFYFLGGFLN